MSSVCHTMLPAALLTFGVVVHGGIPWQAAQQGTATGHSKLSHNHCGMGIVTGAAVLKTQPGYAGMRKSGQAQLRSTVLVPQRPYSMAVVPPAWVTAGSAHPLQVHYCTSSYAWYCCVMWCVLKRCEACIWGRARGKGVHSMWHVQDGHDHHCTDIGMCNV